MSDLCSDLKILPLSNLLQILKLILMGLLYLCDLSFPIVKMLDSGYKFMIGLRWVDDVFLMYKIFSL